MGISLWQIIAILVVVLLLFGTKKLRNAGGDIGEAIKGFKNVINEDDEPAKALCQNGVADANVDANYDKDKTPANPSESK